MSTAVSAPGKVFLAGGYLVLDREYTALVFGLSARIHAVVQDVGTSSGVQLQEITVRSPQFTGAEWIYGYRQAERDGGIRVTQLSGSSSEPSSRNPFVETALTYALTYISASTSTPTIAPTQITILADTSYYSNPGTPQASSPSSPFLNFNVKLTSAHKTGLGSSAALVTALTSSLLTHYLPTSTFNPSTPTGRKILHNLSQAAHCAAQGKVGSGFDIATAVYGTCIYRRFSPSILDAIGEPGNPSFATRLTTCVSDPDSKIWDSTLQKDQATIPKGKALIMCDVDCGSATPGMVKQVLAWKARDPSSKSLWDELQRRNELLALKLRDGTDDEIASAFQGIREKIRDMGSKSGVPIEPPAQTELLDALTKLDGVIGGVVPGAGGYDAVVLLVDEDEATRKRIEVFLQGWSNQKGASVRLLGVKGEMEGVRVEADGGDLYGGWVV